MKEKIKPKKEKLVLLDAHAIIHRAYHALPEFMNSKGEPTGAIYGIATMLFKIITELKPDYIIACYDLPKKTFRHEAYSDYKAGRAKSDDALVSQLIKSRDFFKALSIKIYEAEGFEADDLLGTIAKQVTKKKKNIDVVIASGDMDTLQLVDDKNVFVYTLKKGINDTILYDEKAVVDRFKFKPEYLPDYKGLRGDPSDNIIGIKGIGEKTATILISEFGSLEKMYKVLKKDPEYISKLGITPRVLNLLKEGEEEALFSKTLATIRRDVPITFKIPKDVWEKEVKVEEVADFFKEMEFRSLQGRFLNLFKKEEGNHLDNFTEEKEVEYKEEDKIKITKAQIAYWLLNSEKTNPDLEEVVDYQGSSNLDESLELLEKEVEKQGLNYVYKDIEIPIIPIIKKMEENGILVDAKYLNKLSKKYHTLLSKLEKDIWELTESEFNINSPKQLSEILLKDYSFHPKGLKKIQEVHFPLEKVN